MLWLRTKGLERFFFLVIPNEAEGSHSTPAMSGTEKARPGIDLEVADLMFSDLARRTRGLLNEK